MADTKVKISHILDSQIPDFIHDENPLFKEFLNQYYISQEHEYGNIDIAENITDVKNISNYINLNIVGYQALVPIQLTEQVLSFDETEWTFDSTSALTNPNVPKTLRPSVISLWGCT